MSLDVTNTKSHSAEKRDAVDGDEAEKRTLLISQCAMLTVDAVPLTMSASAANDAGITVQSQLLTIIHRHTRI